MPLGSTPGAGWGGWGVFREASVKGRWTQGAHIYGNHLRYVHREKGWREPDSGLGPGKNIGARLGSQISP